MKKCRFFMLHPEVNQGKVDALEALHSEYVAYVRICVEYMLDQKRLNLPRSEKQAFFPPAEKLTSQIEKNARDHAIQIVSVWAKGVYTRKLKQHIKWLFKHNRIDEDFKRQLFTVGKYLVYNPSNTISQEAIDAYWTFLLNEEVAGRTPRVSDRLPMRMSENTSTLENTEEATHADLWLKISTLKSRKMVWLPLVGNPYVKNVSEVGKGIHARKDRRGRWRFEAVETKEWEIHGATDEMGRIGVDVGLNVIAATSTGRTFGADLKPKFDKLYAKVLKLRSNRQRQNLKENSPRLDRLEAKLTGLTKSATGQVANELVKAYPDTVFVLEDLDLRGCRGQKRFCYRALAHALECKAPTEAVNPAYSSQTCPSCCHVSRANRRGVDFVCTQCKRRSHADVVGGINLLGRSKVKQVDFGENPSEAREVLVRLYWKRRNPIFPDCPRDFLLRYAPVPSGRRLTTRGFSKENTGTASNQMPKCA